MEQINVKHKAISVQIRLYPSEIADLKAMRVDGSVTEAVRHLLTMHQTGMGLPATARPTKERQPAKRTWQDEALEKNPTLPPELGEHPSAYKKRVDALELERRESQALLSANRRCVSTKGALSPLLIRHPDYTAEMEAEDLAAYKVFLPKEMQATRMRHFISDWTGAAWQFHLDHLIKQTRRLTPQALEIFFYDSQPIPAETPAHLDDRFILEWNQYAEAEDPGEPDHVRARQMLEIAQCGSVITLWNGRNEYSPALDAEDLAHAQRIYQDRQQALAAAAEQLKSGQSAEDDSDAEWE